MRRSRVRFYKRVKGIGVFHFSVQTAKIPAIRAQWPLEVIYAKIISLHPFGCNSVAPSRERELKQAILNRLFARQRSLSHGSVKITAIQQYGLVVMDKREPLVFLYLASAAESATACGRRKSITYLGNSKYERI